MTTQSDIDNLNSQIASELQSAALLDDQVSNEQQTTDQKVHGWQEKARRHRAEADRMRKELDQKQKELIQEREREAREAREAQEKAKKAAEGATRGIIA